MKAVYLNEKLQYWEQVDLSEVDQVSQLKKGYWVRGVDKRHEYKDSDADEFIVAEFGRIL